MGIAHGLGLHGAFTYLICIWTKVIVEKVSPLKAYSVTKLFSDSPFRFPIPTPQKQPLPILLAAASGVFLCAFKSRSSLLAAFQLSIRSTDFLPRMVRALPHHHLPEIVLSVLSPTPGSLCQSMSENVCCLEIDWYFSSV